MFFEPTCLGRRLKKDMPLLNNPKLTDAVLPAISYLIDYYTDIWILFGEGIHFPIQNLLSAVDQGLNEARNLLNQQTICSW